MMLGKLLLQNICRFKVMTLKPQQRKSLCLPNKRYDGKATGIQFVHLDLDTFCLDTMHFGLMITSHLTKKMISHLFTKFIYFLTGRLLSPKCHMKFVLKVVNNVWSKLKLIVDILCFQFELHLIYLVIVERDYVNQLDLLYHS